MVFTLVRLSWLIGSRLAAAALLVLIGATAYQFYRLPPAGALFDDRGEGSVTMLDRHGNVFAWRGDQYGGALGITQMSPHLVHAVVATEDKRFWDHFGLDPIGIARAIKANIEAGAFVQGGSTLTQQTAKNVFLSADRTLERKLAEVPMALALELKYSKPEILSIYMNRVYLGAGAYGFEAAAQRYFGKSARLVTPAEAAMLAGLLRAPSFYAPTANIDRAQGRAGVIIGLMQQQGYLTPAQADAARENPARLSQAAAARAGGYFADWLMETLPPGDGRPRDLTIRTTFDPRMQAAAEAAVQSVFEAKVRPESVAEAAVVIMDRTGAVRAMVGGRASGVGQFNRATQALRQTGSAFKPVVYAAAMEAGMRPDDWMRDAPVTIDGWSPSNYSNSFAGDMTLAEALRRSINTVAVRLSERVGRETVRQLARDMGFSAPIAPGASVALGTSETTLLDMTGVFATIANQGRLAEPFGWVEVRDRAPGGARVSRPQGAVPAAMSPASARLLIGMMEEVVTAGTGRRARLDGRPAAGKTGTTQAERDAWFIGFTADYVAGVWMGNDDNTPLVGVTGGGLPAEIWREIMLGVHEGVAVAALPQATAQDWRGGALVATRRDADDSLLDRVYRDVVGGILADEERRSGALDAYDHDETSPPRSGWRFRYQR
ncbi:MAG: PBP1A family penicillin-binding protein [Pseudomonadota bacterium]